MGVRIVCADGEPINVALRRFKKLVERTGVWWEIRRRGYLVTPQGAFYPETQTRRAKRFQKRFKAREATLLAKIAGEQTVASVKDARKEFWRRTGKP